MKKLKELIANKIMMSLYLNHSILTDSAFPNTLVYCLQDKLPDYQNIEVDHLETLDHWRIDILTCSGFEISIFINISITKLFTDNDIEPCIILKKIEINNFNGEKYIVEGG